jgi:hypothetical protein
MKMALVLLGMLSTSLGVTIMPLAAQSIGAKVRDLISTGRVQAEVLEMWAPPRLTALSQTLQQAIQNDPSWWQGHVRNTEPGKPLAYDPKFGISQAEYNEFLVLTDSVRMLPARTVELLIESTNGGWRFGNASAVAGLRGIEIDTLRNQVHSPFGDLFTAAPIAESEGQRATGPWGGPRWNRETVDTLTLDGTVAQFAVGKHRETGRTVVYYDAKSMASGQLTGRESVFLLLLH